MIQREGPDAHRGATERALLVDLYQLTMLRAYHAEGMNERAIFSLFARRLPESRNFLLACGLDEALDMLEAFHFPREALDFIAGRPEFDDGFIRRLEGFRFTGNVRAMPEGTPFFAEEPILEVEAPIAEAQVVETLLMNLVHLSTLLASKAARVRLAAEDRKVVDFGLRRMHGTDAGIRSARAYHVAGLDGTSNVLAGLRYGVPLSGTMAHSYVQAHADEEEAFRAFAALFPGTTLLVDSYDTLEGVRTVVRLARELDEAFQVGAIRLDSGDLGTLSREARAILDEGGLDQVHIFASGGLDEWKLRDLVRSGAPIDGFGVGTAMGVSADAPSLDLVYKLTSYAGRGRIKLSEGKRILPGAKQVFRIEEGGTAIRDVVAGADEESEGRPLLVPVMEAGRRIPAGRDTLERARSRAAEEIARLPAPLRELEPAPYPVEISADLERQLREATQRVATTGAGRP